MQNYDTIIVGAGYAGSVMAMYSAKAGLNVLLIDKKAEAEIGKRAGIEIVEIDTFRKCGISMPCDEEFISLIENHNLYSPTAKTKKTFHYGNIIVNGTLLSQRLLCYAKDAGVCLKPVCEIKDIIIENESVKGIITSDGEKIEGKVIVDAGGVDGAFRTKLPDFMEIEKEFKNTDIAIGYREVRADDDFPENEINSYLGLYGGYIWRSAFDAGIGSFDHTLDIKSLLHTFLAEHAPTMKEPTVSYFGKISVRQNIPNMVANNIMIIGDAAAMANTMSGCGIKTSMIGARLAAEIVTCAIENKDTGRDGLWEFNVRYNKEIARLLAYQDLLRRSMLTIKPEDTEFAFYHNIITSDDIYKSLMGEVVSLSTLEKLQRASKGLSKPGVLLHLDTGMSKAKEIRALYSQYPDSYKDFGEWKKQVDRINESMR